MHRTQQSILVGILVVIAFVAIWAWFARPDVSVTVLSSDDSSQQAVIDVLEEGSGILSEDTTDGLSSDDTTSAINEDLKRINIGNLDTEFKAIDAELNTL